MRLTWVILTALILMMSCAPKPVEEKAGTIRFVTSSNALISGIAQNGGLVVYAYETARQEVEVKRLTQENDSFDLTNGYWEFYVLGWTGTNQLEGEVRCGTSASLINGKDVTIDVTISKDRCASAPFNPGNFPENDGQFPELELIGCRKLDHIIDVNNICNDTLREKFPFGSYRVRLTNYFGPALSPIPRPEDDLISECVVATGNPDGVTTTNLRLPLGLPSMKLFRFVVESFLETDCTGDINVHHFNQGMLNPASPPMDQRSRFHDGLVSSTPTARLFLVAPDLIPVPPVLNIQTPLNNPISNIPFPVIRASKFDLTETMALYVDSACSLTVAGAGILGGVATSPTFVDYTINLGSDQLYQFFAIKTVAGPVGPLESNCVGPLNYTLDRKPERVFITYPNPSEHIYHSTTAEAQNFRVAGWCENANQTFVITTPPLLPTTHNCVANQFDFTIDVSAVPAGTNINVLSISTLDAAGNTFTQIRNYLWDNYCVVNDGNAWTTWDQTYDGVSNSYQICMPAQLADLGTNGCSNSFSPACNVAFSVRDDLNFASSVIGEDFNIGGGGNLFINVFHGNGHLISNLINKRAVPANDYGIFGRTSGTALIEDLKLKNIYVQNGIAPGARDNTAILVGLLTSNESIQNIAIDGQVHGDNNTGPLFGQILNGGGTNNIQNVHINAGVYGDNVSCGGLGGRVNHLFTLSNSSVRGSVVCGFDAGGMIGHFDSVDNGFVGSISNSYSFARVAAPAQIVGGLIGTVGSGGATLNINNSYANNIGQFGGFGLTGGNRGGLIGSTGGTAAINYSESRWNSSSALGVTSTGQSSGLFNDAGGDARTETTIKVKASGFSDIGWTLLFNAGTFFMNDGISTPKLKKSLCHEPIMAGATTYNHAGVGTDAAPFIICNPTQLLHFSTDGCDANSAAGCDAVIEIHDDLDFTAPVVSMQMIGAPSRPFTGEFRGNNHILRNIAIQPSIGGADNEVGLFSRIENASIHELHLDAITVMGDNMVGGLVGRAINSLIDHSSVNGTITDDSEASSNQIGGLVGQAEGTIIDHCSTMVDMILTDEPGQDFGGIVGNAIFIDLATDVPTKIDYNFSMTEFHGGGMNQKMNVGGLVGRLQGSQIQYSFVTNNRDANFADAIAGRISISGNQNIGGLVGHMASGGVPRAELFNSYIKRGRLSTFGAAPTNIGGLVGRVDSGITVSYSFTNDTSLSGTGNEGKIAGEATGATFSFTMANCVGGPCTPGLDFIGNPANSTGNTDHDDFAPGMNLQATYPASYFTGSRKFEIKNSADDAVGTAGLKIKGFHTHLKTPGTNTYMIDGIIID